MLRTVPTLLLLLLGSYALADDFPVVMNEGSIGSPLQNRGTCELSASGRQLLSTPWTIINVSRKPIIAYVETLTVQYSDGRSEERTRNWESFFHPTVLNPGDEIPLPETRPQRILPDPETLPPDSLTSIQPACEAYARWVQFSDGTTFGDPKYAVELLKIREATLVALRHLEEVYKAQGLQRFDEELQIHIQPLAADAYVDHLRRFDKQHGAQATVRQLETHIKVAEERARLLR